MKNGVTKRKITYASIAACVLTLQMGAFSVTLETLVSGVTELPFSAFVGVMQPIHLAIGLVEGLITAAVLRFVYEARPEMLWTAETGRDGKRNFRRTLVVLAAAAAVLAGVISLGASALPDGLEWSMERVAGTADLAAQGRAYETAESIQKATALLPDYGFSFSDSALGTTVSGLLGGAVVLLLCVTVCRIFKFFRGEKRSS